MAVIVRIRRSDGAWYLGYRGSLPAFEMVAKADARICLSVASAAALCKLHLFADCEVVVENIPEAST